MCCWRVPECGSALVDLVFVLDSSESVGAPNWKLVLDFVQSIAKNAEVDTGKTRIGVETYRYQTRGQHPYILYCFSLCNKRQYKANDCDFVLLKRFLEYALETE